MGISCVVPPLASNEGCRNSLQGFVIHCWLWVAACWLLVTGCWLLDAGWWVMAACCWAALELVLNHGCKNSPCNVWGWLGVVWGLEGSAGGPWGPSGGPCGCLQGPQRVKPGGAWGCMHGGSWMILDGPWEVLVVSLGSLRRAMSCISEN